MDARDIQMVVITVVGGLVLAALSVVLYERLPVLRLSEAYIQSQVVVYFSVIGFALAFIFAAKTAYGRLLGIYLSTSGLAVVGGLLYLNQPVPALVEAAAAGLLTCAAVFGLARLAVGHDLMVRLFALVIAVILSFGVIFLVFSIVQEGRAVLVLPLVLLVVLFAAVRNVLRQERAAI